MVRAAMRITASVHIIAGFVFGKYEMIRTVIFLARLIVMKMMTEVSPRKKPPINPKAMPIVFHHIRRVRVFCCIETTRHTSNKSEKNCDTHHDQLEKFISQSNPKNVNVNIPSQSICGIAKCQLQKKPVVGFCFNRL